MAEKRKRRTKEEMATEERTATSEDALVVLVADYAAAVERFAEQTLWQGGYHGRPLKETLSAARATAALGAVTVGIDGFDQADAARILADQSLNTSAGYRKCQWQHERFLAAVTARVLLALWGRAAGEEEPVTEAVEAVAKLLEASGGRK